MSRIFISYKRVDKDKVFKIKDQIEAALGEKCWIDLDGIESDAQFVDVIMSAIDSCDIVLFMYSKEHSIIQNYDTDWTIRELTYAQSGKKRIVFVNIDNTPLTKWFRFMFPQKQQIYAQQSSQVEKLTQDLKQWLGLVKVEENNKKVGSLRTESRNKMLSLFKNHFTEIHKNKWDDLITAVFSGNVIPVFGPDIMGCDGDIHQQILDIFVDGLGFNKNIHSFSELLEDQDFLYHLHRTHSTDLSIHQLIYQLFTYTEAKDCEPSDIIKKLLGTKLFPFVISMTFTPVIENVLKTIWGEELRILAFHKDPMHDDDIYGPTEMQQPTIYYMLGKVSMTKRFCVTDEDMLDYASIWCDGEKTPHNLTHILKSKKLLFIGNTFDKMTFLMLIKNMQLRLSDCTYVYTSNQDLELSNFLLKQNVFIKNNIEEFVTEFLERLHKTQYEINPNNSVERIDIYVSSSSKDNIIAKAICKKLTEKGLRVNTSHFSLKSSEDYFNDMKQSIRNAYFFVPILTKSIEEEQQEPHFYRREWEEAVEVNRLYGRQFIIPVIEKGVEKYGRLSFPLEFTQQNYVSYQDESDLERVVTFITSRMPKIE